MYQGHCMRCWDMSLVPRLSGASCRHCFGKAMRQRFPNSRSGCWWLRGRCLFLGWTNDQIWGGMPMNMIGADSQFPKRENDPSSKLEENVVSSSSVSFLFVENCREDQAFLGFRAFPKMCFRSRTKSIRGSKWAGTPGTRSRRKSREGGGRRVPRNTGSISGAFRWWFLTYIIYYFIRSSLRSFCLQYHEYPIDSYVFALESINQACGRSMLVIGTTGPSIWPIKWSCQKTGSVSVLVMFKLLGTHKFPTFYLLPVDAVWASTESKQLALQLDVWP